MIALAGCNSYVPRAEPPIPSVNADYRIGDIRLQDEPVPTLKDVMNWVPSRRGGDEKPEDRLRAPAMRDSALAYGARAGLAYTSRGINASLKWKAKDLTRIYDFNRILIRTPSGVTIMPPVISEAKDTYETNADRIRSSSWWARRATRRRSPTPDRRIIAPPRRLTDVARRRAGGRASMTSSLLRLDLQPSVGPSSGQWDQDSHKSAIRCKKIPMLRENRSGSQLWMGGEGCLRRGP